MSDFVQLYTFINKSDIRIQHSAYIFILEYPSQLSQSEFCRTLKETTNFSKVSFFFIR